MTKYIVKFTKTFTISEREILERVFSNNEEKLMEEIGEDFKVQVAREIALDKLNKLDDDVVVTCNMDIETIHLNNHE